MWQVHRIAHHLWKSRQRLMARALQSRVSEVKLPDCKIF